MSDDLIPCPVDGKVQRIAVTTTAALTALATSLVGMGWLRVKAVGADVDFIFGTSGAPAIVKDQVGSSSGVGYTLQAGQAEDFFLPGAYTHISWDASGSGFIVLTRSSRDRVTS